MNWRIVGKSFTKPDALAKVTGTAKYAGDLRRPGMLFGKAVRSPYAHASIRNIDISAALQVPGVKAVLTAAEIPGENRVGMTGSKDQPVLASEKVRFLGEAVAVVAAETPAAAAEAAALVKVDYEPLPVVGSLEEAMAPDAPPIRKEGNLCWHGRVARGDFAAALRMADVVITGEYTTQPVEHAYLETEAVLAEPLDGGMRVWSSTKSCHLDQAEIARVLGWPKEKLHVLAPPIGGSFGGKSDLPLNCMAALLCWKTGHPISMVMEREESLQVSTKRHAIVMRLTHCADKNGRLLGVKLEAYGDAGGYIDYTPSIMQRLIIHGAGPYRVENVWLEGWAYLTNNPLGGAMRGFGMPQIVFAGERQMDRLAEALHMDPLELRLLNALREGDRTATGQVLGAPVGLSAGLRKAREVMAAEPATPASAAERAAWGLACFHFGNGRTGMPNPGVATLRLMENGHVQVAFGSPDIGQGSNLTLAQIAAEVLGLELPQVEVVSADTALTPDSGTTSGTRLTAIVGKGVFLAAQAWKQSLLSVAEEMLGVDERYLTVDGSGAVPCVRGGGQALSFIEIYRRLQEKGVALEVTERYDPPTKPMDPENGQGDPYAIYTYGVQLARTRVNIYTGKVTVDKVVSILDIGNVINPLLLQGQIEGGAAMGLGYALLEEVQLRDGRVQNPNFDGYLLPTALDTCETELLTLPGEDPEGPFGAKGVGEPSSIPTAAAIANAVSRALGVSLDRLPLSLERVTAALEAEERKETASS